MSEKMLAFVGTFREEEWCTLIHGETRGKAKSRFERCNPGGGRYTDIQLRKLPGQDDLPFTFLNAKAAGFEYENEDETIPGFINDCDCPICRGGN
jgi:hypothetical protein